MVPFQTIPPSEPFGRKDFFDSLEPFKISVFCPNSNFCKIPKNPVFATFWSNVRGVLLPLQKDTRSESCKGWMAKNLKEEFRNEKPEAGS